jgi:hypothetical protein
VFNEDDRFYFGSRLSSSTYIAIVTSIIDLLFLTALVAAGVAGIFARPGDDDDNCRDEYERIR